MVVLGGVAVSYERGTPKLSWRQNRFAVQFNKNGMGITNSAPLSMAALQPVDPNYFTEMCSGSEAGSYLRLVDFVYHSTPGLRVIKEKKKKAYTLNPALFRVES